MLNKSSLLAGGVDNHTHRLTVVRWANTNTTYDIEYYGYDPSKNKGALNPNALYVNGSSYAISGLRACYHYNKSGGISFYDVTIYFSSVNALGLSIQFIYI